MVQGENDFGKVDGLCQVLEQEGQMDWHDEAGSNRVLVESSFDGMAAVVQEVLKESSRMNLVHEEEDTNNAASAVLPKPMEDVLGTVPRLSHLLMPVLKGQFPSLTGILKPPHFQGMPHDDSVSRRRNERVTCFASPS